MDFPGDLPTFEDGGRTKFQVDYLPTLDWKSSPAKAQK
jgi:hypothetical protein